jgi:hypothetical protein
MPHGRRLCLAARRLCLMARRLCLMARRLCLMARRLCLMARRLCLMAAACASWAPPLVHYGPPLVLPDARTSHPDALTPRCENDTLMARGHVVKTQTECDIIDSWLIAPAPYKYRAQSTYSTATETPEMLQSPQKSHTLSCIYKSYTAQRPIMIHLVYAKSWELHLRKHETNLQ